MGKNHRHSKKLKSERGKTKLKTKFLPKGGNITKTDFRLKPISIPEQLPERRPDEPTTFRHLNFKDISLRLRHHNPNVVVENLRQLRQLLGIIPPTEKTQYLRETLESTTELISSPFKPVRIESIGFVLNLISVVSEAGIEPYFDRLLATARCAVTSISEGVREDSITLIEGLVSLAPSSVADRSESLLKSVVTLLGTARTRATRITVLGCFRKLLGAVVERKLELEGRRGVAGVSETLVSSNHVPICYDCYDERNVVDIFAPEVSIDDWVEECMDGVLPMLRDTWLEVQPEGQVTVKSGALYCTTLSAEAADLLRLALGVLTRLRELAALRDRDDARGTAAAAAVESLARKWRPTVAALFQSFPFVRRSSRASADERCLDENLTLCRLVFASHERVYDNGPVVLAVAYLNDCLTNPKYIGAVNSETLMKVFRQFFKKNMVRWGQKRRNHFSIFVKNAAAYYTNYPKPTDTELFGLLCEYRCLIGSEFRTVAKKASLHLALVKTDWTLYNTFRTLLLKGVPEAQETLTEVLPKILNKLKRNKSDEIEAIRESRALLTLYTFFTLETWCKEMLLKFAEKNAVYDDIVQRLL